MWVYLLETRVCRLGLLNAGLVGAFHFLVILRSAVIGPLQESEIHAAQTLLVRTLPEALRVFVHRVAWEEPDQLLRLVIPFGCRFISFVFRVRVESFPHILPSPTPTSHPPLFFCQVILLLIFVHMFSRASMTMSSDNPVAIIIAFEGLLGFVDTLHGLVKHVIYFVDVESHGNSLSTFKLNAVFDFLADTTQLIILGVHAIVHHAALNDWIFSFMISVENWIVVAARIARFWRWLKLSSMLHEKLPVPTMSEITDTCVVCRLAMTPDEARKLPCGHCCHVNCIIRWAREQATCPLCGADLTGIMTEESGVRDWIRNWTDKWKGRANEGESENPFLILMGAEEEEDRV
jgi:hypothetical protein